jgi:hypothetical protein
METLIIRREFDLPEEDIEYLNARGFPWETISDESGLWLLINDFPIPDGYKTSIAQVAIKIPSDYLMSGLDMVYFSPALSRTDEITIPATEAKENINNLTFQRWSRHRTAENPWRPGLDNIATHLSLVEEWLLREFRIRPKGGHQ